MEADDDLVVVYSSNRMDAEMMRSVLEGSGIRAVNTGGNMAGAYPVNVGSLGEGKVLVRREDEDAAREVIAAATHGDLTLEEDPDTSTSKTWIYAVAVVVALLLLWIAWKTAGV